ncbi:hypothetical protein [Aureimonas pseudogalii]|uniref:Polysaccharide chain length determinant N-terminal domain-containing protein n=1 Tax=Aureimonas pseudogalii TaxID=1744844 RepID=A0A7W6EGD6_9HYPH|nr:hypothetical protein [Aureimonas pseudogalii]MBB3998250.1 hypothetical protein [Aureimonas pseudogalii]
MRGPAHGSAAPSATSGRGSTSRALWLVPPVCLAGLAFVAVSWLPSTYRASLLLTGPTDFARSACVDGLAASRGRDAGLGFRRLVGWFEGGHSLAMLGMRETGVRTVGDRSVELWVQDGEAAVSQRLVGELAGSIVQCVATSSPSTMVRSEAAEPVAQSPAPIASDRAGGAATLLRTQLEEAKAQRDAARSRLAALEPAEAAADAEGDDPAAVAAEARALENRARSLQRAIADLEAGRPPREGETDIAAGDGWGRYAAALSRRDDLQAGIRTMAETLLDGHPRMTIARLRLAELQADVQTASRDLLRDLGTELNRQRAAVGAVRKREAALAADRERAATQDAERAAMQRDEDVAAALVSRLEAAVIDAERQASSDVASKDAPADRAAAPGPSAQLETMPTPVLPQAGAVSLETLRPPIWPAVIGAGSVGLALSLFGLATVGRRREGGGLASRLAERRARGAGETAAPNDGDAGGDALEVATIDEVIEALMTSGISRALLVQGAPASRPLGVDIIRRLALRGQSAAIVDLSDDQATARAMGAGSDAPGMSDLIEGDATFATIARRDFATRADIIPGGRRAASVRLDTLAERRNVLDFIERSYETLLVDCGAMEPTGVRDLVDNDAALLLAVQGATRAAIRATVEALREAGLDEVILVGDAG